MPLLRLTFALAALLTAAAPVQATAQTAEAALPAVTLPAITVTAAARATMRDRVIAAGTIAPVERVSVTPKVEGQPIDRLMADLGDRVTEGQVLAQLSDTALTLQKSQLLASRASALAAIAQAEATRTEAEAAAGEAIRVRDRQAELLARGVGTQAGADQSRAAAISAEARVKVAEQALAAAQAQLAVVDAQLAVADLNLSRTQVIAPVGGEIVERNAMLGAMASAAGQPMFVIVRDGLLELRADVAETDLLRLAVGQRAMLSVVGLDAPIPGLVRLVEPAVDTQTRLGRVRIAIEEPAQVRSGLFAQADILVAEREAVAVPITAISSDARGAAVFKVAPDGAVTRTTVVTGIRDGSLVEIIEGLAEGELVVARAGAFVRDGDRINPVVASN
ncbi:MAG: efflux RND transporter periplasmic adaptor subunit [Gemmobacter sp.]